ncbi:hypothetical protein [Enterococcus gallinarum]|uniref:hypothetical protein n=1 Tax=Enterococcus gallinarum TaxID=1353 RepID=UPI00321A80C8
MSVAFSFESWLQVRGLRQYLSFSGLSFRVNRVAFLSLVDSVFICSMLVRAERQWWSSIGDGHRRR